MLKIVEAPNPILNKACKPCTPADKSLIKAAKQMSNLMYSTNGCGIAAPQVGLDARFVIIDVDWDGEDPSTGNPIFLVNPVIEETAGEPESDLEACLSCPGISVPVTRPPWVKVSYFDLDGDEYTIEGDGLLGRCLQHEIDHLDGITLLESCDPELKLKALAAYDKARSLGAKPGDTSITVE